MRRLSCLALLLLLPLLNTGCQCYRLTHRYGGLIDDLSDYKMEIDPLYVPGLDISRVGMPDWQRFGLNRLLCPCANGRCCRRGKIYYPAEYRMRYWAALAEQEQEPDLDIPLPEILDEMEQDLEPLPLPKTEEAPPPLPPESTREAPEPD